MRSQEILLATGPWSQGRLFAGILPFVRAARHSHCRRTRPRALL